MERSFRRRPIPVLLCLAGWLASIAPADAQATELERLRLPSGFVIELYARVPATREILVAEGGRTVFVSSNADRVFAVIDQEGDGTAEGVVPLLDGLRAPHGLALEPASQDLYIAEQHRILRLSGWRQDDGVDPSSSVIFEGLPDKPWHGWRSAAFGPDGRLYVSVGAPCNICQVTGYEGTIISLERDGSGLEVFARGLRNSVGFDWHPRTKQLFITDNGGDRMGDLIPPDELNHAPRPGLHFGYPYVWGSEGRAYPGFEQETPPAGHVAPVVEFDAHAAALSIHFYRGSQFPQSFRESALVALHGSWNRDPSDPAGYKVMRVTFDEQGLPSGVESFIEGWLRDDKTAWGRPVHFAELPDGSLLLSDDHAGLVYRITYRP